MERQSADLDDFQSQSLPPLLHPSICPDWSKIWGDTFRLPPDGFHRSQFAFLSSVLANCVVVFFSFSLSSYSSCSQSEMTSCRREVGLNTYPQGPAGEPGTNGRRCVWSTGGWDICQGRKIKCLKRSFLAQMKLKCGKCLLRFDLMWLDRRQTVWTGGLWWEGIGWRSNKYIWMEKRGRKTLRRRPERGNSLHSRPPFIRNCPPKRL